jgi:hypothetical protein
MRGQRGAMQSPSLLSAWCALPALHTPRIPPFVDTIAALFPGELCRLSFHSAAQHFITVTRFPWNYTSTEFRFIARNLAAPGSFFPHDDVGFYHTN